MQIVVRPAAADDINEAHDWYESRREGLGHEFLAALTETRERIVAHPYASRVLHRDTRRALLPRRFPYVLYYRIVGETIAIVACMHGSRHPRRWRQRH